ncbi:hypothetical protein ACFLZL_01095 [Thermodesulfobacteriota bacterium]
MNSEEARNIIHRLAGGADPISGEPIPENSPYNQPVVIRALYTLLQTVKNNAKPRKTIEERKEENRRNGRPLNAGLPWGDDARQHVASKFNSGVSIEKMATEFERTPGAVIAELKRQGIITEDQAKSL